MLCLLKNSMLAIRKIYKTGSEVLKQRKKQAIDLNQLMTKIFLLVDYNFHFFRLITSVNLMFLLLEGFGLIGSKTSNMTVAPSVSFTTCR